MPSKIHHFLWKASSRSLPKGSNLKRREVTTQNQCCRCYSSEETEKHILFDCPYAQHIWRASGISNRILTDTNATLEKKMEACLQCCTSVRLRHMANLPFWLLWRIWKNRNMLIFQQKYVDGRQVLQQACKDAHEQAKQSTCTYSIRRGSNDYRGAIPHIRQWKRPPPGWIKCNVDASFVNSEVPSKAGWILRDDRATYRGAGQAIGRCVDTALESELHGILIGMQQC